MKSVALWSIGFAVVNVVFESTAHFTPSATGWADLITNLPGRGDTVVGYDVWFGVHFAV